MASAFLRLTVAAVIGVDAATVPANVKLFFSEYAEGSGYNKYLEIYNAGTESANLGDWATPTVSNGPTTLGVYEFWNIFTAGAVLEPGKVYVIAHGSAAQKILDVTNQTYTYLSNGDDGVKLAYGTEADHVYVDAIGDFQADPGTGWDICGEVARTVDITLVRKTSVTAGNPDWDASRGTTADNCEWVVYPKDEWKYVGVHQVVVLKGVVTADLQGTYGGMVKENYEETQLVAVSAVDVCGKAPLPMPYFLDILPTRNTSKTILEPLEGMLIMLSPVMVTDTYNLARYGEMTLSSGWNPVASQVFDPVSKEHAEMYDLYRDTLMLDDANPSQNPDPDSTFVGNCNGVRTNATKAMGKWLKTHPTGSTTDDILIIGDLNAHHYETPIQTLITEFGYVDMIDKFTSKETSSSYVYKGLASYLDHALASSTLMRNITMVMAWKINADENRALDYNTEYKSASQVTSLYNDGPFRSSDHDPIIIGLYLPLVVPEQVTPVGTTMAPVATTMAPAVNGAYEITVPEGGGCSDYKQGWVTDGGCSNECVSKCTHSQATDRTLNRLTVAAVIGVDAATVPANVKLFFSEYAEGSGYNKYLEIYNAGTESANLGDWATPTVSNGPTTLGVYEFWNIFTAGAVLEPGKVYVIAHGSAAQKILDVTNQTYTYLSNGDDGVKLAYGTEADHVYVDAIGDFQADPGTGWDICGEVARTVDITLVRKTSVTAGNPDWDASRGTTADNCEWVVYPKDEWKYVGVHQVADGSVVVSQGDLVVVRGMVKENYEETQLVAVSAVDVCGKAPLPMPYFLDILPTRNTSKTILEPLEGMLIMLSPVMVTDTYNLARYGEMTLSSGWNPVASQVFDPVSKEHAEMYDLYRDTLMLDDANPSQNPDPVPYPGTGMTYDNYIRTGDTLTNVTGPLSYAFSLYKIQKTPGFPAPAVQHTNPREETPPDVKGRLRIAGFNVLNYFNGDNPGVAFSDRLNRGASNADEFAKQRKKTLSAIAPVDAAVVGLLEIENDGFGLGSAVQDIVDGLNAATAPLTYTPVTFNVADGKIGTDAIANAIIYQPMLVSVVGRAMLDSSVDPMFRSINRPTLAVTFKEVSSGNEFTVVVNHLKSKGSSCVACCADPDSTFVGNCNGVRTNATKAMAKWLKTHPTGSTTDDILIIGDLNAHHYETPIQTLIAEFGYMDMIDKFTSKETSSSYVYKGLASYLDHALASSTLMRNITMVMAWKINADENRALDYNTEYKSASQVTSLYNDGPFRSSDHDPIIIGLYLPLVVPEQVTPVATTMAPVATTMAPVASTRSYDNGGASCRNDGASLFSGLGGSFLSGRICFRLR
ncbi:unnamed protein product [Polarella glacialis]|uniref:LTD domain-containing protein n=1 Tax=Polarella glacialis TaxID=89957 RepID=A0A813ERP7_POLGL|nr:unnamed protein product [Polarella glacialis]